MICPLCQFANATDAARCRSCGAMLSARSSENSAIYPDALPDGSVLAGAYAIEGVLGQGGFGITYRAHDQILDRAVAIKEFFPSRCRRHNAEVAPSRGLSDADFRAARAQFLAEARTLARCHHVGIVGVHTAFEANQTAYMVMELLHGQSLAQLLSARRGCMPEAEAVAIIERVGGALQFVHEQNLLHRDIKPDNIIACDDGRVMLIDFGTARETVQDQIQGQTVIVTPGYAPLEQYARQAKRGAFTDVYSLAATLYHLLTGQMPPAASDRAMGVQLRDVREMNPNVSASVAHATQSALQMEIARRPQSVREFLDLLRAPIREVTTQSDLVLAPESGDKSNGSVPTELFADALHSRQQMINSNLPSAPVRAVQIAPPRDFVVNADAHEPTEIRVAGGNVSYRRPSGDDASNKKMERTFAGILVFCVLVVMFGSMGQLGQQRSATPPDSVSSTVTLTDPNSQEQSQKRREGQRAWNALTILPMASSATLPSGAPTAPKSADNYRSRSEAARFSADGKRVAYIDDQAALRVVSLPDRQLVRSLQLDPNRTSTQTLFSPDNATVAVVQTNELGSKGKAKSVNRVDVWSLRSGTRLGTFSTDSPQDYLRCKSVSNDGQLLLQVRSEAQNRTRILLWNPKNGQQKKAFLPDGWWWEGARSPNGKEFVFGAQQGDLNWLNWNTGKQKARYNGRMTQADYQARFGNEFGFPSAVDSKVTALIPLEINAIKYSLDGATIAARNNVEIGLFDANAKKIGALTINGRMRPKFAISPAGKWLIAQGNLPYAPWGMVLWNVKTGEQIRLATSNLDLLDFSFSRDGKQIYGVTNNGNQFQLKTWKIGSKMSAPFANAVETSFPLNQPYSSSFLPTIQAAGKIAVANGDSVEIRGQDGTLIKKLRGDVPGALALQLSPGARFVAARIYDGSILLRDVESGRLVQRLPANGPSKQGENSRFASNANPHSMAFSPDGKYFACARVEGDSSRVELWGLNGQTPLLASLPQAATVNALAFSPDNGALICGDQKGAVRWYDVPTRQLRAETKITEPVAGVVFTASRLIVVGASTTISYRLPNAKFPKFQQTARMENPIFYEGKINPALHWDVSADGKLLVKSVYGLGLQIWQLSSGVMLQEIRNDSYEQTNVCDVTFSADGAQLTVVDLPIGQNQVLVTNYRRDKIR